MRETVLITGAGNGLGEALSFVFAENDHHIIVHARKRYELDRVSRIVADKGVDCYTVQGDLRDDKTLVDLTNIANEKDISILVNNAATRCPGLPLPDISDEYVNDLLNVGLYVPIQLTRMLYPFFQTKKRGMIVNINSITAIEPKESKSISSAAKGGLQSFTDSLREEAREYNIRLIGVYPTRINTKPEFEYGMDPIEAARKIYDALKDPIVENFVLDGRPEEFRSANKPDLRIYDIGNE